MRSKEYIEELHKRMNQTLHLKSQLCNSGNITATGWCPEIWDTIMCWNSTPPSQLALQQCPSYVVGCSGQGFASKQCMPNGQWYWSNKTQNMWSNYTECCQSSPVMINTTQEANNSLIKKYFPILKNISTLGYTTSLFTLIIAFCILVTINLSPIGRRKLRCPRNILHMHLFASFVMRAFMALLKDILFVSGIGLPNIVITSGDHYWLTEEENNWHCKMLISLWQYFILANYFWILMEGIYLHNLVFLAFFTDANSSIARYYVSGWGLPVLFILPWVIMRIMYEDTYCWTINEKPFVFLFIRIPIMLSILINFVLFINIVRVLLVKLRSTMLEEMQSYKRWARSTLVLVPLFGVHYAFFIGMSYSIDVNEKVEIVWLFCDQLFASFQGFFVAVLYCFLNGEVRTEMSKIFRSKWPRIRRLRWGARQSTHSVSTCSCNNVASKPGNQQYSSVPKWWKAPAFLFQERSIRRSTRSMASTQDVGTRGGSLASSRDYLEIASNGQLPQQTIQNQHAHQTSPLCSKYTDQSLLSFCSNISEASGPNIDKIRDQHRWSDSEYCHLAYELHNLQQREQHP
ncbi:hypothetical protein HN011_003447 [Eciton burchellii]|nr:hypothetical protein HN011_003447 [Eciton burchellii]